MQRRAALGLLATAALAGCGFELRRDQPLALRSVALVGFTPNSHLAVAMRQSLARSGVALAANPAQAEAVLDALEDKRERVAAASTAAGQVREITLRVRLRFRVATPDGRLLLPISDLSLSRDMSYNETVALAKQQEEAMLFRAMEDDIVAQVLRRLASVRLSA